MNRYREWISNLSLGMNGTQYFINQFWMIRFGHIRRLVLDASHGSRYFIHLGSRKMYLDLKRLYWLPNMKDEISTYVGKCLTCSKVKVEYQKTSGLLRWLEIIEEHISMDFTTKLPKTSNGYNTIKVVIDRLTNSAHFLPIKETDMMEKLTRNYLKDIVKLNGIHLSIIYDMESRFTSRF